MSEMLEDRWLSYKEAKKEDNLSGFFIQIAFMVFVYGMIIISCILFMCLLT
jgi:hypothetical protein